MACEEIGEDDLFARVRRAWPYRNLARSDFDAVVRMHAEGVGRRQGRAVAARLHRDALTRTLSGRRSSRLVALQNGGAIPDTAQWALFRKRYLAELAAPAAGAALEQLYDLARARKKVTLLYAARDAEHNNAVVLRDLLEGMRKPPSSSGPAAAAALGRRRAVRPRN